MEYDEEYNKDAAEKELQRFNSIIKNHQSVTTQFIGDYASCQLPPCNSYSKPVHLMLEPQEDISIDKLIHSDNKLVNKVVLALAVVCKEAEQLLREAEDNLYIPILLYENCACLCLKEKENPETLLSKFLPTLHLISHYVKRVYKVSVNILQQLNSLYPKDDKDQTIDVGDAHFQVVFEKLGRLFASLITLDDLISKVTSLHTHWTAYRKLVKSSIKDPSKNLQSKDLLNLDKFLNDIDKTIMRSNMFKGVISQPYDAGSIQVTKNTTLRDEMATVILGWCSQIDHSSTDLNLQSEHQQQVLALSSLFVFHHMIFNVQDKKIAKSMLSLFKKYPCVVLGGQFIWLGEKYLRANFPSLSGAFTHKMLENLQSIRINQLTQKIQNISADVTSANVQMNSWCVQMTEASKKHVSKLSKQDLNQRILLLSQGIFNGHQLRDSIELLLAMHTCLGRPMTKQCALSICKMLEMLKSIQVTLDHNTSMIAESLPHLRQFTIYQMLTLITSMKNRLSSPGKDLDNQRLDTISAFTISQSALFGCGSKNRLLIARIALSLANRRKVISEEDLSSLLVFLRKFELLTNIETKWQSATQTSFLYHHRVLISTYLEDYYQNFHQKIQYFMLALGDCSAVLKTPELLPYREELLVQLSTETYEIICNELLEKVCKEIETDLRLSTHHHLKLDDRNPFSNSSKSFSAILNLPPLIVFGKLISPKEYVEQYLERVFYGLSVVAPHDCSAYEQMHHLAFTKYGLMTVPSHLPSRTIELTVDVLDIMRNINSFVQRYHYNLNQQFFLEAESNNKHLNVVSIKDISNSIQTHGSGIINTAVNYSYQFMRQKFQHLSQLLYDEHIKSRLMKNLQFWKESKLTQKFYLYERAERFHRGIKKLGVSPEGFTYLDKFRKLVTVAGNAMGYVRLIRTAQLHCSSTSTQFIPDLQQDMAFTDLCSNDVSDGTLQAAKNLDKVIDNIRETFYKDADYFQMLVNVFSPVVDQPKNTHLRNFFLLVPPLTINYIEHIIASKENLNKKYQPCSTFTDDGFAMGVAYLLRVLKQTAAFESLHWWLGIKKRFESEKKKVEEERGNARSGDAKLQQALSLSLSRLTHFEKEFELLHHCLTSAQVLFKDTESCDHIDT